MLKLLDYGTPKPFGAAIGGQRDLMWPVNTYRVTLPKPVADGERLNAFEQLILKLLAVSGAMDAQALAEETRIPLDLIESILLRLQDKALIDPFNVIVEKEDVGANDDEQVPVFATALVFRELVTGQMLPFMHWLDDNNPLQKQEENKRYRRIPLNDAHTHSPPTQRDIISLVRVIQRRSAASGREENIPPIQKIMIIDKAERHFLHCPIAIQKSDGEFRIADPFGNGFSLILERAFEHLLEQDEAQANWLKNWKASLSNPKAHNQDEKPKEAFETEDNWLRFPKLLHSLRLRPNAPFHSIAQIYSALEWALFYACIKSPYESELEGLKFTEPKEHCALLAQAATKIGLTAPRSGFRPIREGKLIDFQNGKAELETLLAIAILQAEDDESNPLRRLAKQQPELINQLLHIKKQRDEKGHGKGKADAPEMELSDATLMREIIETLRVQIKFSQTLASTSPSDTDSDFRADSLLDARASLQSEFGYKTFNRFGANLQDRLVHVERAFLSFKDGDDALAFVRDLYAALQSVFEVSLIYWLPPEADDAQLIAVAGTRAVNAGLCSKLPEGLRTVRPAAVRQTLQGVGQSLGACVIALLLMADEDVLKSIASTAPSFVDDMTAVITKRGHGNEPLPLLKEQVAQLRKASYKILKTLIEV
ncbi:hypothetical protein [Pseudomonas sp. CG7]|uniref:hypothetical protein n=1 Tax=Pseudomonas sp. CG7 TaxID=191007 RepID=UPI00203461AF|nr:hypothetical protein [Pseudomonas sp. CG7]